MDRHVDLRRGQHAILRRCDRDVVGRVVEQPPVLACENHRREPLLDRDARIGPRDERRSGHGEIKGDEGALHGSRTQPAARGGAVDRVLEAPDRRFVTNRCGSGRRRGDRPPGLPGAPRSARGPAAAKRPEYPVAGAGVPVCHLARAGEMSVPEDSRRVQIWAGRHARHPVPLGGLGVGAQISQERRGHTDRQAGGGEADCLVSGGWDLNRGQRARPQQPVGNEARRVDVERAGRKPGDQGHSRSGA